MSVHLKFSSASDDDNTIIWANVNMNTKIILKNKRILPRYVVVSFWNNLEKKSSDINLTFPWQ